MQKNICHSLSYTILLVYLLTMQGCLEEAKPCDYHQLTVKEWASITWHVKEAAFYIRDTSGHTHLDTIFHTGEWLFKPYNVDNGDLNGVIQLSGSDMRNGSYRYTTDCYYLDYGFFPNFQLACVDSPINGSAGYCDLKCRLLAYNDSITLSSGGATDHIFKITLVK